MDDMREQRNGVPVEPAVKCDICKKGSAEWFSTWSKGEPYFTPLGRSGKQAENETKYCDACKDISKGRFRP